MKNRIGILALLIATFLTTPITFAENQDLEDRQDYEMALSKKESKEEVENYEKLVSSKYTLNMHKKTFFMPISHVFNPSTGLYSELEQQDQDNRGQFYDKTEAEFQLSFFLPITRKIFHTNWDIMAAYTHRSWWQIYNNSWSRPFRETNYMPEVFFRNLQKEPIHFLGFNLMAFDLGFVHQSNGQTQVLSRSWDRVFGRAYLSAKTFSLVLSGWIRKPEKRNLDDNPNIETFLGIGEIEMSKSFGDFIIDARLPIARKPGVEVSASYPLNERVRLMLMAFNGYGQSMIEYNVHSTRVSLGFSMENFIDKMTLDGKK